MIRFSSACWVLAALAFGSVALAAEPDLSTPEAVIRGSLQLLRDGKVDDWVSTYCSKSSLCQGNEQIAEQKRYGLARAAINSKLCLHGEKDEIVVTRTKGDPAKDATVTVWVKCEEARLPVPTTLTRVVAANGPPAGWQVSSFSW